MFNGSGLIGQIVKCGNSMSVVSSLTDGGSSVGGMVNRSGVRGLVQGDYSDTLLFTYLPSDADIRSGDICSSSGDGGLVPPGIPIGKVISVKPDKTSDTKIARVRPFVRFDTIHSVLAAAAKDER